MFEVIFSPRIVIEQQQERSFDEGEFQIIALTQGDSGIEGELHRVNLNQIPLDDGTSRPLDIHLANISESRPWFAMVVRAIEFDNSTDAMREADRNDYFNAVMSGTFAGTSISASNLWAFGITPELRDRRWRDDDDKIGVSARVYPNLGRIFARPTIVDPTPGWRIPGSTQRTTLLFAAEGARWHMTQADILGRWPSD